MAYTLLTGVHSAEEKLMQRLAGGHLIRVVKDDITRYKVDGIVNPANQYLRHGGGIAGAIVRQGGASIQAESDSLIKNRGPLNVGEAVSTTAGNLPAKRVIHTVGPIWQGGNDGEDALLASSVKSALEIARKEHLNSVSIPAISSGIFGFPKARAVRIIMESIENWSKQNPSQPPEHISLIAFDTETHTAFKVEFQDRLSKSEL